MIKREEETTQVSPSLSLSIYMIKREEETTERDIEEVMGQLEESNLRLLKENNKRRKTTLKKKSKKSKKSGSSSSKVDEKESSYELVTYEELPEYMKENEYIRGYYRSEWPISHAFLSLFSWHNETINVWTHLVGFLVFLGFTVVHLGHIPEVANLLELLPWPIQLGGVENVSCNQASNLVGVASPLIKVAYQPSNSSHEFLMDPSSATTNTAARWPFFVFLAGSMFCLLTSTLCHLLCCHSRRLNILLSRLDYTGIAIMIVSSFFPPIYYIFLCDPIYQTAYLTAISAFGILTVFTLFSPELSKGKFRSYRAFLFCAMGLSGVIPAVHATVVNWTEPRRDVTLAYEGAMAALYLTGTMFYVTRVPERWKPGKFDLTGHSHQIFHVFVILGALAHYGAALVLLEYRDAVGCGSS